MSDQREALMNNAFDSQVLAEKLCKLNNTQQSIETLSHWCIYHRKKAKVVVETWEKQFNSSEKEQRISLLYLSNDILQNSRRKGVEFVVEFWKALPAALKAVCENGDERGKTVVSRLVDIWEERKVFGSRSSSLKDDLLGSEPPPPLDTARKSSRSVRVVRRDPRSIKVKLAVGGLPEKIVSAFQSIHTEHSSEDMTLSKCKAAIKQVMKLEKDIEHTIPSGEEQKTSMINELQEQETILCQCIEQLQTVKAMREALVTQLKKALGEQESKLENLSTQLQLAQVRSSQSSNLRQRVLDPAAYANEITSLEQNPSTSLSNSNQNTLPSSKRPPEELKKTAAAVAAEVAAKLAASTQSAQMLTSVLSSFAAEEAKNAGLSTSSSGQPNAYQYSQEKRMKYDNTTETSTLFVPSAPLVMTSLQPHPGSMQMQGTTNMQGQNHQQTYAILQSPAQQYVQGGVMLSMPYSYTVQTPAPTPPPPPPPLPPHIILARPQVLHQPAPPSFQPLQPPGMQFYNQSGQPTGAGGQRQY